MSALRDFFAELGDYLGEKYFSPDLGDLNYLNSDAAVRFLPLCIVGLCAGIFLAALIYYYNCEYLGRAVRRLYAAGAFSPEEAKTLAEIRCDSRAYRKTCGATPYCRNMSARQGRTARRNPRGTTFPKTAARPR